MIKVANNLYILENKDILTRDIFYSNHGIPYFTYGEAKEISEKYLYNTIKYYKYYYEVKNQPKISKDFFYGYFVNSQLHALCNILKSWVLNDLYCDYTKEVGLTISFNMNQKISFDNLPFEYRLPLLFTK
jgi:hypothetical protein